MPLDAALLRGIFHLHRQAAIARVDRVNLPVAAVSAMEVAWATCLLASFLTTTRKVM